MTAKPFLLVLGGLLIVVWVRLLSSEGGLAHWASLDKALAAKQASVAQLTTENALLKQEVRDLQSQTTAIETLARQKLGMIGQNEAFVRVIQLPENTTHTKASASIAERNIGSTNEGAPSEADPKNRDD